jgi:hypothetical protein
MVEAIAFSVSSGLLWGLGTRSVFVGLMTATMSMLGCRLVGGDARHRLLRWTLGMLLAGAVMLFLDRVVMPYLILQETAR